MSTFKGPINIKGSNLAMQDGGAVTQITSATTGVTLNKPTGAITTVTQNIAAAGEVAFVVTNSLVTTKSVPLVAIASGTVGGTTIANVTAVAAGSFTVTLTNLHATVAETGVLVLNYMLFEGSITAVAATTLN